MQRLLCMQKSMCLNSMLGRLPEWMTHLLSAGPDSMTRRVFALILGHICKNSDSNASKTAKRACLPVTAETDN